MKTTKSEYYRNGYLLGQVNFTIHPDEYIQRAWTNWIAADGLRKDGYECFVSWQKGFLDGQKHAINLINS